METILIINTVGLVLLLIIVTAIVVTHFCEVDHLKKRNAQLVEDKKNLQELNEYCHKELKKRAGLDPEEKGFDFNEGAK